MATAVRSMGQDQLNRIVAESRPERLSDPGKRPLPGDHVGHVVQLVGWGQTALAADHLLFPELTGVLPAVVGGIIRQLNLRFAESRVLPGDGVEAATRKVRQRQFCYEALLETAINFAGAESRWLDGAERCQAEGAIRAALAEWEAREAAEGPGSVAAAVVRRFLARMKRRASDVELLASLDAGGALDDTDRRQAEACAAAARMLTRLDMDRASVRNDEGWSQADVTVGRIVAGIDTAFWTKATLAGAKAILRKYRRTQIDARCAAVIWPEPAA